MDRTRLTNYMKHTCSAQRTISILNKYRRLVMNRSLRTVFFPGFFAIVFSAFLFAQTTAPAPNAEKPNISGKWSGSFDVIGPGGNVHPDLAIFFLKQDGTVISGSIGSKEDQQLTIKSGKINGYEINFETEFHDKVPLYFHLRLEGAHILGDASSESNGNKFAAKIDVIRVGDQTAAPPTPEQLLFNEISHMDTVLFDAFNHRDLEKMKTLFTSDLEFYHDKIGVANYQQNMDMYKQNFANPTSVRRELVEGSLEVYPIKDFGAVEIGLHRFYSSTYGQREKLTATAKFIHVWKKTNGEWKIARVISYDHR